MVTCLGPRLGGGEGASLARGLIIAFEPGRQKVFPSSHGFEPCVLAGSGAPQGEGYLLSPVTTMRCLCDVQDAINCRMPANAVWPKCSLGDGGGHGCTTVWLYLIPWSCALKHGEDGTL